MHYTRRVPTYTLYCRRQLPALHANDTQYELGAIVEFSIPAPLQQQLLWRFLITILLGIKQTVDGLAIFASDALACGCDGLLNTSPI